MPVEIVLVVEANQVRETLKDIPVHANTFIARESLQAIQAPDSPWPVRTGRSKAGFSVVVAAGGLIEVLNDQDYAPIVEDRTGAATAAIQGVDFEDVAQQIVRALDV